MVKKIMIVVVGLTFFYNVQMKEGIVYRNASPHHMTVLVDRDNNVATHYSTGKAPWRTTATEAQARLKKAIDSNPDFASQIIAIINNGEGNGSDRNEL